MNKKGFTLIELMVSLILVTIILASMSVALIKLKETYNQTNNKTDIDLIRASITRIIGNDINDNGGISNIYRNDDMCITVVLKSGKKRLLKIENIDGYKTEKLTDENKNGDDTFKSLGTRRTDKSTLKYIDYTSDTEGDLLYIKTLNYTCHTKKIVDKVNDEDCDDTTGNKFIGISYEMNGSKYRVDDCCTSLVPYDIIIRLNDSDNDIYFTTIAKIILN